MLYHTHQSTSLLIGSLLYNPLNITNPLPYFTSILVTSLIPDMDSPKSKINQYNPLSFTTSKLKHRGITHSILGVLIFSILSIFLFNKFPNLLKGSIVGYSSHLLGDYFTRWGIPLQYPFNKKRNKAPITFTTGSNTEYIIFIISIILFGLKLKNIMGI